MRYSMGTRHFAEEIEFFYQKPKPGILPSALAAMNREGTLARSDVRLFMAAFLAELARSKKIDATAIMKQCAKLGDSGRHLAAWLAHLAMLSDKQKFLDKMPAKDRALRKQLRNTPAPLEKLRPETDKTVLRMYWGAFMASGKLRWLDPVIDLAMAWHNARKQGLKGPATGADAAASLYEYAPRHELIRKRLEERLNTGNAVEKDILEMILKRQ